MANEPTLRLICERKIRDLMPREKHAKRWEASGVLVKDQHFFVVFDDRSEIARLSNDLESNDSNDLWGMDHPDLGYEGIAYNSVKGLYYLLVESRQQANGCYQASVVEYDQDFEYLNDRPLDFTFESANKGFEALSYMNRSDKDYLLALCEGNKCKCGAKGRKPGGGRVQLFSKKREYWRHVQAIELPKSLNFVDYSGMSIDEGRVAIVSQVNSMLWIGQFDEEEWKWRDDGQVYEFPRNDDGEVLYGNIEGVAWLSPASIVVVSDRRSRKKQPNKELSLKDQSIHLFEVPA